MKQTLAPSVTNRDPKGRKFMDIIAAAYDKAGLSESEAQNVNNAAGLADHIDDFITINRFSDDEVGFGADGVDNVYDNDGSASGFFPQ